MTTILVLFFSVATNAQIPIPFGTDAATTSGTTLDPANKGSGIVLSNGNLTSTIAGPTPNTLVRSTIGHTIIGSGGLTYVFEVFINLGSVTVIEPCGILNSAVSNFNQEPAAINAYTYYGGSSSGQIYHNNVAIQSAIGTITIGVDYLEATLNCNAGEWKLFKNGTQIGTTITGLTGTWYVCSGTGTGAPGTQIATYSFTQATMTHVPTGSLTNW